MLQQIYVLYRQVVGVTNGTVFGHDQQMARSHRVRIFECHDGVILVDNVGRLLLTHNACEYVLLGKSHTFRSTSQPREPFALWVKLVCILVRSTPGRFT